MKIPVDLEALHRKHETGVYALIERYHRPVELFNTLSASLVRVSPGSVETVRDPTAVVGNCDLPSRPSA